MDGNSVHCKGSKELYFPTLTGIAVGYIDDALGGAPQEDADDSLARVTGDAVVVVDDAQENQRVHDNLFDRPQGDLLRLDDIHTACFPPHNPRILEPRRCFPYGRFSRLKKSNCFTFFFLIIFII